ncbi:GH25 family lysozyme [Bacillus sp. 1NLA3E]|uniref:GH25 family lysozyme n=1 Tax=Bacillus sp. 1NLA3E TaxID=666686 RepID=UPI000247F425|nr:GH25 family lysozyme [Bacillus sp. 1NLA3E]AGK52048.1 lyzozyme M1 [Bacillus sp. 1NLA3E]
MKKFNKTVGVLALSMGLAFSFGISSYASAPDVDFIDVSHWNGESGLPLAFYQTIKAGSVDAVVVKVSEGTYYVDPASSVNVANAKQAGMIVHAYHFARFTSNESAKSEAQWFDKKLQLVGFNKKTDGYVVVDVEASNLSSNPAALTEYTNTFIAEMNNLGYEKVDLYSGSSYYNSRLQPAKLPAKPWIAAYPSNPVKGQPTAKFSNGTGAWQWTSSWSGMAGYGRFDASEDYAGKYTNQVKSSSEGVKTIGSVSLVDYMKAAGMDASFSYRTQLAEAYGIENYSGSSAQNLALLSKLQSGVKPAKVNIDNSKLTTNPAKEQSSVAPKTTPTSAKTSTYVVKAGDTVGSIAKRYNTTISVLASLNNIKNVSFIRAGQVLKIFGAAKAAISQAIAYHKVLLGETVSVLAKRYGTTITQIKNWNNLDSKYTIFAGKTIRVR